MTPHASASASPRLSTVSPPPALPSLTHSPSISMTSSLFAPHLHFHLTSLNDSSPYSDTFKHLAESLAKLDHPSDERVSRLIALCPKLPRTHGSEHSANALFANVNFTTSWRALERSLHGHVYGSEESEVMTSVNDSHYKIEITENGASGSHGSDISGSAPLLWQSISATHYPQSLTQSHAGQQSFTVSALHLAHSPLDERSQAALLALLRYLQLAAKGPHTQTLVPLALKYFLALPFMNWEVRSSQSRAMTVAKAHYHGQQSRQSKKDADLHALFLSSHPTAPFASDMMTLFVAISAKDVDARQPVNSAILILLRQLVLLYINTPVFLQCSQSLTSNDKQFLHTATFILQGVLFALGEASMIHDEFTATELAHLLLALLNRTGDKTNVNGGDSGSGSLSPPLHALTLRALVLLLSNHSSLLNQASSLSTLFDDHVEPATLTSYKKLTSPSSPTQHYSTLILTYSLHLSLLCAVYDPTIKNKVMAKYKEVLDKCLNTRAEGDDVTTSNNNNVSGSASASAGGANVRIMVGCVDVTQCTVIGFCELARHYVDLIPIILDTCRSILLTSRRLSVHPKQRQLRTLLTAAIGSIFLHELSSNNTSHISYQSSMCRSFIQSSLTGVMREDLNIVDERTLHVYQRQLVLLLDLIALIKHQELNAQVLPLIIQRFSSRPRFLYLIIPQLTEIAQVIESAKDVDGIVTLLINVYLHGSASRSHNNTIKTQSLAVPGKSNFTLSMDGETSNGLGSSKGLPASYSQSNIASVYSATQSANGAALSVNGDLDSLSAKANIAEIPVALTRLAQGIHDEDKRIQMMKRMLRLFSEIAYEVSHQQVLATSPRNSSGVKNDGKSSTPKTPNDCGALLPVLASLLCPHFHSSHGSHVKLLAVTATPDIERPLATSLLHAALSRQEVSSSTLPVSSLANQSHRHDSGNGDSAHIGVHVWSSRESNVKWFRRCWYIITHFDFATTQSQGANTRNEEWAAAVRAIAAHSPVLLIDNKRDYLTAELEGEALRFPSPHSLPFMQKHIVSLLMPHSSQSLDASTLSASSILYLIAVHELESQRIRADSQYGFAPVFAYIADEDIHKAGLHRWVSAIAESVFAAFVEQIEESNGSVNRRTEIESHVNFLLGKVCSRYVSERSQASIMLARLVKRFPFIQWSTSCLSVLLTLYHSVDRTIDTQLQLSAPGSLTLPFHSHSDTITTGTTTSTIDLPESLALRQSIRNTLGELAANWLSNAHTLVPAETLSVIQEYIQAVERRESAHTGSPHSLLTPFVVSLSQNNSHSGIALTLRNNFSSDVGSGLSTLVASLAKKEQFLGEVRGICLQWQINKAQAEAETDGEALSSSQSQGFGLMLSTHLMKLSTELLSDYRSLSCPLCHMNDSDRQKSYHTLINSIEQLIYHSAALLVLASQDSSIVVATQDLLHLTCKVPAQVFVTSTITAAVFAWEWLVSANKQLELPLLIEMKAAWAYSIDRQVGVFSGKRETKDGRGNSGTVSAAMPSFTCEKHPHVANSVPLANITPNDSFDTISPHVIWIRHLTVHYRYTHSLNREILNVLTAMIHKAFARPELITSSAASFGARFRLLNLGLILIAAIPVHDRALLLDRVMGVAFSWFYQRATWYDGGSVSGLKEAIAVIQEVRRALMEEQSWSVTTPVILSSAVVDRNNVITSQHAPQSTLSSSLADQRHARLTRYRDLLLFLLAHEISRIIVWNSPNGSLHDGLNVNVSDPQFASITNRDRAVSPNDWEHYTRTAWEIAPILAIRFAQRFGHQSTITATLRILVKRHPEAVYDISDAVVYLVHSDNVVNNVPELRNLVYWSPTSLTNALLCFTPPFCHHRMVMEYAVHTLYSHPVDQVVFYLSQIVQCLRNDHFRLLYDFLVQSSHFSILLSHQLIWLCQAELGEVKESGKPIEMTPFRMLCQSLMDDIIAKFTPSERAYWKDEFAFFEQVTAISGILKPLPTKPERKAKIKAELEKIIVKPGLYLPTNPKLQIKEIICSSGTPMQSAAKVPILVAFMVTEQELDEEWIRSGGREVEIKHQAELAKAGLMSPLVEDSKEAALAERVEDKYPVALNAAEMLSKEEQKRRLERQQAILESSEMSTNSARHISPSQEGSSECDEKENDEEEENSTNVNVHESNVTVTDITDTEGSSNRESQQQQKVFPQACIFKVGDDCRQDALALQVIAWCKQIFDLHSLPLFLYPYHVLPNRTGGANGLVGGIIECVPAAQTRDELGKAYGGSLSSYYRSKYGSPEGAAYLEAQRNFICSEAAYAITSYILQVKDRHNGNLMFDKYGHVVHIDFGFIFTISPANNLRFERPGFKLTEEMVELMGGQQSSYSLYQWFQLLVVRGFLACREHYHEIEAMVQPMLDSSLVCFRGDALGELRARFFPDKTEREAADAMLALITAANNSFYTNTYDWIQAKQQSVFYYKKGHGDD